MSKSYKYEKLPPGVIHTDGVYIVVLEQRANHRIADHHGWYLQIL
jgi:hypothetical protein